MLCDRIHFSIYPDWTNCRSLVSVSETWNSRVSFCQHQDSSRTVAAMRKVPLLECLLSHKNVEGKFFKQFFFTANISISQWEHRYNEPLNNKIPQFRTPRYDKPLYNEQTRYNKPQNNEHPNIASTRITNDFFSPVSIRLYIGVGTFLSRTRSQWLWSALVCT